MRNRTFAVALLALLAGAAFAQEAVTFRRTFAKDGVDRYAVTMDMNIAVNMMGESSKTVSKTTHDYLIRILELKEDGSADVEIKTENMKSEVTVDGERVEFEEGEEPENISGKGNLNPLMRLTNWKSEEGAEDVGRFLASPGATMEASFFMVQLPEKPVKPGDTWEIPMPTMDVFAKGQKTTASFAGLKPFGEGKTAYVLNYEAELKLDIDLEKRMRETQDEETLEALGDIKLDGTVTYRTAVYLDPSTFVMLRTSSTILSKMTTKISSFDMDVETEIKSEMNLK